MSSDRDEAEELLRRLREDPMRHFVGGGPSSGQAVEADDAPSLATALFSGRPNASAALSSAETRLFAGRGRRLGHTAAQSPPIADERPQRRSVEVTLYANGFRVGDDPLRPMHGAEAARFFAALRDGFVPDIISAAHPNAEIEMELRDCTDQQYTAPFVPFAGAGHQLQPNTTNTTTSTTNTNTTNTNMNTNTTNATTEGGLEVRDGEETARLAIVNLSGDRKEFIVNPKRHTVGDVFALAAQCDRVEGFRLIARDVPPRPLLDRGVTIDDAKLRNATIMMRPA